MLYIYACRKNPRKSKKFPSLEVNTSKIIYSALNSIIFIYFRKLIAEKHKKMEAMPNKRGTWTLKYIYNVQM